MKKYIMFCYGYGVGGGQNYINGKVKYLKEHGWCVYIFPVKEKKNPGNIVWPYLSEYEKYSSPAFSYSPFFWPTWYRKKVLKEMVEIIGKDGEEIIIESHNEPFAVWGELLAKELNAKHFCYILEEQFNGYSYMDFFSFKYDRKEMAGINKRSIPMLFNNYKAVEENAKLVLDASQSENGIVDYNEPKSFAMVKLDWNIGYIGRSKQYADTIIDEVRIFAAKHQEKKINFCILGELRGNWEKDYPHNVTVTKLGFLVPMPKAYFKKLDVAIAGAGCARYSAFEGVETIIVDVNSGKSNGVFGYSCFETLYTNGPQENISETLEAVLVDRVNKDKVFAGKGRPAENIEKSYAYHLDRINNSDNSKKYYDFENRYPLAKRTKQSLKFAIRWFFPVIYETLLSRGLR